MMIRAALQGHELTSETEHSLLHSLKQRSSDIVPVISLATHLAESGLDVTAFHYNAHLFWQSLREETLRDEQIERYRRAKSAGVRLETQTEVTAALMEAELGKRRLLMCGIEYHSTMVKHALVLYGVDDAFLLIDPLQGRIRVPVQRHLTMMCTSFGTWCISVGHDNA